jgi:hypothetical protein
LQDGDEATTTSPIAPGRTSPVIHIAWTGILPAPLG